MKKLLLSTFLATLILFLWSGLSQVLPWGITATQNISSQAANSVQAPRLLQVPPNTLTTEQFDAQFVNKISTYTTDTTFSWIVSQPLNTNYAGYFLREFFTQLVTALCLSLLLLLTAKLELTTRMLIVGLASFAAISATYGQLMNWWRLPPNYALGVGFNLFIAWVLTSFIVARFIIRSRQSSNY